MRRSSVRFRITAVAVLAVAAVLILASVGLVAIQQRQLTAGVDAGLVQRADDLTSLMATAPSVPDVMARSQQEGFVQVVEASGSVVASTPNLEGEPPLPIAYAAGQPDKVASVTGLGFDPDVFRVLSRTVTVGSQTLVLHVGTSFDLVERSFAILTVALGVTVPVVVVLVGALVWWLVGRTLEPVEAIRSEVAEIGSTDLHRRVPVPAHHDEVSRLAETMNQMLARVEAAVERQRRFVADASHELRSPLTRMRAELEVSMAPVEGEERALLESLREEVVGLQHLVEDLLHLARADAGHLAPPAEPVDLDDIVLAEADALSRDGGIAVDMSGVSGAQVLGDAHQLTRAVRNLCENARAHARGEVTFSLAELDGTAVLTVADDGPGVPSDKAEAIFERFARLDASRSQETGGAGLGLAITRDIVERHGGTIGIDPDHGDGACFVVTLPLA